MSEQKFRKGRELTFPEAGSLLLRDASARVIDYQGTPWRYDGGGFQYLDRAWSSNGVMEHFAPFYEALPAEPTPEDEFVEVDRRATVLAEILIGEHAFGNNQPARLAKNIGELVRAAVAVCRKEK